MPLREDNPIGPLDVRPAAELRPGPSTADARDRIAPAAVGLVGALALIGMAAVGRAEPSIAVAAALGVAVVGGALSARGGRATRGVGGQVGVTPEAPVIDDSAYRVAMELAPNPVMLVSGSEPDDLASRRILFANAAARELLHIPREGALLLAALRHPDVLEAFDATLFDGRDQVFTYETGGANTRQWRIWARPLPSPGGAVKLMLVVMRDETEVLLNERRRSDFLANASHELRTPLTSLSGFIETLRGHARDDPQAQERFLAIMSRQAERMARLIDDLLSLSRIELNEHVRPSAVCNLSLVVKDVADALAPQLADRRVSLEMRLAPDGAPVLADRDQIVQVVQNLLDNAVKYSPEGGRVEVSVEASLGLDEATTLGPGENPRLTDPAGGRMSLLTQTWTGERYARLAVVDHGAGLSREHLPRLAERFYRVEGQKSSGTGLGLAIVKHIVNRHRGGMVVESAPGKGAAFLVYLPTPPGDLGSAGAPL